MEPVLDVGQFTITFPQRDAGEVPQDVELCDVTYGGETQRIRFHDYTDIFDVPGLYEHLFHEELQCCSPRVVSELLGAEVAARGLAPNALRVFDVGAGNGLVGEELRNLGVDTLVAADILPAARAAAERDRPGLYDEYLVADLTDLDASETALLEEQDFNCLVTVAALGFGDMPPEAFRVAYDMVADGGLVALTINEKFLDGGDGSGFSDVIEAGVASGALKIVQRERYRHRLSVTGDPIHYVAVVLEKHSDI
ncbi:MAG: hypothetical protein QOF76_216 [Solirubrobacteraceae bacterium]|jgi:predicted TPR repeat methyltransferase|nr:hypothetical protein [Solirubrobacteraceae bacterium]